MTELLYRVRFDVPKPWEWTEQIHDLMGGNAWNYEAHHELLEGTDWLIKLTKAEVAHLTLVFGDKANDVISEAAHMRLKQDVIANHKMLVWHPHKLVWWLGDLHRSEVTQAFVTVAEVRLDR